MGEQSIYKFVQIGSKAFNPDQITDIHFNMHANGGVMIYFAAVYDGDQAGMKFEGDDYTAFLAWWENVAEVYNATL